MNFFESVYEVVKKIPRGKVASYGAVAKICGAPKNARQVGWALHVNPDPKTIPCHRVVTKDGQCCEGFAFGGKNAQQALLKGEGVEFLDDGRVDMQKFSI